LQETGMTDQPQPNSRWDHRYVRFRLRALIVPVLLIGGGLARIMHGPYVRSTAARS
jgi:hypothetical protein